MYKDAATRLFFKVCLNTAKRQTNVLNSDGSVTRVTSLKITLQTLFTDTGKVTIYD